MSKLTSLVMLLSVAAPIAASAQNCALSGTGAWSDQLTYVVPGCDVRLPSPSASVVLRIDENGAITVTEAVSGRVLEVDAARVEAPAMASWSPNSDAFFVNDGEGSGMWSSFRLFRLMGSRVVEDITIGRRAITEFRAQKACSAAAVDPSVWGLGWTKDGLSLHLLVQATVNAPCDEAGAFLGLTMRLNDGALLERLSERQARRKFGALLPHGLRGQ